MNKVKVSNTINRLGCGTELLYCTRVYTNARTYGGAWIPMEKFLDTVFYLIRGQKQHCRASYLWEKRNGKKETEARFPKERKRKMNRVLKRLALELQEWEFNHTNPPRVHPPTFKTCDYCGQESFEDVGMFVSKYVRNDTVNYYFCNEPCANEFYLQRLRKEGL